MEIELAWAAGFFDGEGCFTPMNPKSRPYPAVIVAQSSTEGVPEVLERFKAAVGCGRIFQTGEKRPRCKPCYHFQAWGPDVERIRSLLWPYIGSVKRQQWRRMMDRVQRIPPGQLPLSEAYEQYVRQTPTT